MPVRQQTAVAAKPVEIKQVALPPLSPAVQIKATKVKPRHAARPKPKRRPARKRAARVIPTTASTGYPVPNGQFANQFFEPSKTTPIAPSKPNPTPLYQQRW
jgi:hypothetical protein